MATPKIRIGAVSYLNARPLVHGLARGMGAERCQLSYATPAVLADRMAGGGLDVALLPVVELARIPDLEIVPGLGITTKGPSRSVFLLSRCPASSIDTLALDPESRTSNMLARLLLAEVWKRTPELRDGSRDLDASLAAADATVRIGDKALFEPVPDGVHVHDLGQVWTRGTGLPFVFAVWAARPHVVDRELYGILHESRRRGTAAVDAIAEDYAWNGAHYPKLAKTYLTEHIHYRLGAAEIEALQLFFDAAHGLDLIDRVPEIRMALTRWTTCHAAAAGRAPAADPTRIP